MIKKIFVGVLLAGVFGLLVLGAVNRTLAKSDKLEPLAVSDGGGRANGTETGYRNGEQITQSDNYSGQGRNSKQTSEELSSVGGGKNRGGTGYDQSADAGTSLGVGLANVDTWEDPITVVVESVSTEFIIVSMDDGSQLEIEGRSLRYMIENGFVVQPGDELVLIGFYEDERFEIGSITNNTTQQTIAIRSETGRPLWAGRGQGSTTLP
jgi:hypothetical protein